jgi:hypothetical protein
MRRLLQTLRQRDHLVLAVLLLVGIVAYFGIEDDAGHRGGVAELDGYYYYVYLRSVQVDGDIELGNEYRSWGNPFKFGKTSSTGYHRNIFGIGPALLWAPFFFLTHLIAWIGVKLGIPLSLDGMSRFHQVGTFLGTLLYGWLAVVLCHRIARRVVGEAHALWAALGAALAGPLPYYCLSWASYSHAQAAMATSLLVLLWLTWRDSWTTRRWLLFGASAGLVLLVRPACVAFLVLPVVEGIRVMLGRGPARGGKGRSPAARRSGATKNTAGEPLVRRALGPLCGAAAALLVFSPQLVAWKVLFGSFWVVPQGEGFMRWGENAWYATLFSPRNGLLTSAPLMVAALCGLAFEARRRASLLLPLCGVFVAMVLVNGAVYDWWGWGFSARRFTSALPLLAIGLGVALRDVREWLGRRPQRALAWITALFVLGAVLFNIQWMRLFAERNLKWYSVRSTEGLYMTVAHSILDDVYDTAGNPLSLPASGAFALRHGGSPRTYDRIDGSYLLGEAHPGANPSEDPYQNATLDMGDLRFRYNLSEAFGNPKRDGEVSYAPLRRRHGRVFLPINRPGPVRMVIGGRAIHPGTRVELRFNGEKVGTRNLSAEQWQGMLLAVPGRLVQRGINRLDLIHHLPGGWDDPGPRCVEKDADGAEGRSEATPQSRPGRAARHGVRLCSKVDLAVVSGGLDWGRFAEVWVDGQRVSDNSRGINAAVVDRATGRLLGARGFDVVLYPALYGALGRWLDRFPEGSLVALGVRDRAGRNYRHGGREALGRIGAVTNLRRVEKQGYAAIGSLGAPAGTALERVARTGHARVRLGRKPPPWREVARYRAIVLR